METRTRSLLIEGSPQMLARPSPHPRIFWKTEQTDGDGDGHVLSKPVPVLCVRCQGGNAPTLGHAPSGWWCDEPWIWTESQTSALVSRRTLQFGSLSMDEDARKAPADLWKLGAFELVRLGDQKC